MYTWIMATSQTHTTGEADTRAQAWHAAHVAAADTVRAGTLERLTLDVDGDRCTITPADSGDAAADAAAALEVVEAGRIDLVAAHVAAEVGQ